MSIRGNQETVSLVDLLNLIQSSGNAGTLSLRLGERSAKLLFLHGQTYLISDGSRGPERILAPLVRQGKLSEPDLLRALQIHREQKSSEKLGDLLVKQGLVRRHDLEAVMRSQFEEEICDLLFQESCEYEFSKDEFPTEFTTSVGTNTFGFDIQSILMEASRRQDEWRRIRDVIKSEKAILCPATVTDRIWNVTRDGDVSESGRHRMHGAGDAERQILARWKSAHALFDANPFDGTRTIDNIVGKSGVSQFVAMGVIAGLIEDGVIRELTDQELQGAAIRDLQEGRERLAYELYEWANESDSLRLTAAELDKFFLHPETLQKNVFSGKTSSQRALQVLSRLLGIGQPFRFMAREGDSQVEAYLSESALRLHLLGPRRSHSTARYLRRRKALSMETLDKARRMAKQQGRNVEMVLLEEGFVSRDQWLKAVKDKAVSGLFSIFGWPEAYIEVRGGEVEPPHPDDVDGLVCEIPLHPKLRESLRRDLRRWRILLEQVPSSDVVCICEESRIKGMPKRARHLFNGRRSVVDLIQVARVAPLELVRFMSTLLQDKTIRPLADREHYERMEQAQKQGRLDMAIALCKSAIAWGYAPQLYRKRLSELRRLTKNAPTSESRPVMQGDVDTFGIAEIIQLLHHGKRSGTLKIRSDDLRERTIYLDHGELYLVEGESGSGGAWDLDDDSRGSIDLKEIVVQRGLVAEKDLTDEQRTAIHEDLFDAFLWENAEFEFVQNLLPSELRDEAPGALVVKLVTPRLLLQAMARLNEWDELKKTLKSPRAIFRYAPSKSGVTAVAEAVTETASLYNGRRSLDDIVRIRGENRFRVYREARGLVEKGSLHYVSLKDKTTRVRPRRQVNLLSANDSGGWTYTDSTPTPTNLHLPSSAHKRKDASDSDVVDLSTLEESIDGS